jgi:hypothetical protein
MNENASTADGRVEALVEQAGQLAHSVHQRQLDPTAKPSYLLRRRSPRSPAHIWLGQDTACRSYRSGGLGSGGYFVVRDCGQRPLCQSCEREIRRFDYPVGDGWRQEAAWRIANNAAGGQT